MVVDVWTSDITYIALSIPTELSSQESYDDCSTLILSRQISKKKSQEYVSIC